MKKAKTILGILVLTLVVSFAAGCGSTDKKAAAPATQPASQSQDHSGHTPEQMKEHTKQQ